MGDPRWSESMLESLGLRLESDGEFLDDSDDPDDLRECLIRTRLAAWAERKCRTERAVVMEIHLDDDPLKCCVAVAEPTGDRAKEMDLCRAATRDAVAHMLASRYALNLHHALCGLAEKVAAGEVPEAEAWARVVAAIGAAEAERPEGVEVEGEVCDE